MANYAYPWLAVVKLSNDFFSSQLHPKEKTLEESLFLGDTDLESIVMQYAHGECHTWTVALHQACPRTGVQAQMDNFSLLEEPKTPLPTNDQLIDQEKFNKSRERYKNQKANSRLGKFKLNKDI